MTQRLVDAGERARAICERERNVLVDAGAGTGKTTLLIARLLHLIAPEDDGPAFVLERVAAITFTRKAAGELKLRLREAVLRESARQGATSRQRTRLEAALEALDNAAISTVHSFADRLLRLRPADARLSPGYELIDEPDALIEEAFAGLLHAAQRGELESEAAETLHMFQAAGLRLRTEELEFYSHLGLDAFVRDVIETRDRPVERPALRAIDLAEVRRHCDELRDLVATVGRSSGSRWLRSLAEQCLSIVDATDATERLRRAIDWRSEQRLSRQLQKAKHFDDDPEGWEALRWLNQGTRGAGKNSQEREGGPLADGLVAPLLADMAARLVRMRELIISRYEAVKRSHGLVDQIDLLIELRDLLQRDLVVRAFYQARFDHVLVDEFQDTDPLQAEIVLYLCERGAVARAPSAVQLQPGKLTIVGDPKQSIYRFRRADIATYAGVCAQLRAAPVCEAQLTVNFRSAAPLLGWLNQAFDAVLGAAGDGPSYDADSGTVRNVRLQPAAAHSGEACVHVLPFGEADLKVDEARDLEGEALAHYLRYLVEASPHRIVDPHTGALREPHYGDIAVMMIATQTVHHLTTELDRCGVPHVVRGGTLFMQDPLHQQFILGLCALADRNDGVARAALLRPPFFAVSLEDLLRARVARAQTPVLEAAEALVTSLRHGRMRCTPGEMARRVLEQTGFGSYVATSVNGAQRLARLYELCLSLDELGRESRLDFDGVMSRARSFIDTPPRIDAPLPVDADAVQVITTHQAKGLEWPIVALWDGRAGWEAYLPQVAFTVDASSGAWAIDIDGLSHDPSRRELREREKKLRTAERRRVAYVAATRARDIFIVPEAGAAKKNSIAGTLLLSAADQPSLRVARYERDGDGWWRQAEHVSTRPIAPVREQLEAAWTSAATRALHAYLVPAGVTSVAHARDLEPEDELLEPIARQGRHGPIFGSAVHRALQLLLTKPVSAEAATRRAALEHALPDHHDAALADVRRAHTALRSAGLLEHELHLEYPVAGTLEPEALLTGYIDLLAASASELIIVDFKTDAPPRSALARVYPEYIAQVQTYRRILEATAIARDRTIKTALLFTADGALHWV